MVGSEKHKKEVSALCVAGERDEYVTELSQFYQYLVDEAGFPEKHSYFMSGARHTDRQVRKAIKFLFEETRSRGPSHTAVLVYNGHGAEDGISPVDGIITYDEIAKYMGGVRFLFINNCCSSGAVIEYWRERKLLPHYGSVLAATDLHDDIVGALFLNALIQSAKHRKPFRKRILFPYYEESAGVVDGEEGTEFVKVERSSKQYPRRCGIFLDNLLYPSER